MLKILFKGAVWKILFCCSWWKGLLETFSVQLTHNTIPENKYLFILYSRIICLPYKIIIIMVIMSLWSNSWIKILLSKLWLISLITRKIQSLTHSLHYTIFLNNSTSNLVHLHFTQLTLFLTRKVSSTSWRGPPPSANLVANWATKNPKTVLESSQKMNLGLLSARNTNI